MVLATGTVSADSRSDARTHYQAGVKFYNGGDYKSAIREFSAAQQLAPADLNNYNLALCYDKLGDPEPAIQYYRAYLDQQPSTDKRGEIEASINRLESAGKSVAAKKAEEARRLDEERRAAEAKRLADDQAREAARRADEERRAAEARRPAPIDPVPGPGPGVGGGVGGGPGAAPPAGPAGPATGVGSTGTPGSGMPASTGDAQLDRVQQIDVASVRDQRVGGASSGMDPRDPRAANGNPNARVAQVDPNGAPQDPGAAGGPMQTPDSQPKAKPVYKKWWFWAVIGVAAYVVYAVATEDSNDPQSGVRGREVLPLGPMAMPQRGGGLTLMRF